MIKLKKIGILSAGYVAAIFSVIFAFLQVLLVKIMTMIPAFASQIDATTLLSLQGNAFWIMLIVTPLAGLVGGFVAGLVMAIIYNYIVSPISGGIKIELSENPKNK